MSFGEPWRVGVKNAVGGQLIADANGYSCASVLGEIKATRIVACVNALAGLAPEAVKEVIAAARQVAASEGWAGDRERLRDALAALGDGKETE